MPLKRQAAAMTHTTHPTEPTLADLARRVALLETGNDELMRALGDNTSQLKIFLMDSLQRRSLDLTGQVQFYRSRGSDQAAAQADLALDAVKRLQQRLVVREVFVRPQ
ncbi:hypothetical protein [Rhodoferax sp.]|uniref:hypothetical protein n=1 Tax=Rhodoferax sp. TaxID=50421 RepID=UPI002605AB3A|nr:hypothetical protein [Rhodoferax sp.]MDD3938019.1 hypothetical protein [Rhodoferax sp.]